MDNRLLLLSTGTRDRGYNHDPGQGANHWNDQAKSGSFHSPFPPTVTTAGPVGVDVRSPRVTASRRVIAPIIGLPPDDGIARVHHAETRDNHGRVPIERQVAAGAHRTGSLCAVKGAGNATAVGATTTPGGTAARSIASCTSVRRLTVSPLSGGPLRTAGERPSSGLATQSPGCQDALGPDFEVGCPGCEHAEQVQRVKPAGQRSPHPYVRDRSFAPGHQENCRRPSQAWFRKVDGSSGSGNTLKRDEFVATRSTGLGSSRPFVAWYNLGRTPTLMSWPRRNASDRSLWNITSRPGHPPLIG